VKPVADRASSPNADEVRQATDIDAAVDHAAGIRTLKLEGFHF
jgi:hypothetical protein